MRRSIPLLLLSLSLALAARAVPAPPVPVVPAKDLPTIAGPMLRDHGDPAEGGMPSMDRIQRQIRRAARANGRVLTRVLPALPVAVQDHMSEPDGRKAYQITVAPGVKVHARLEATHKAWFKVSTVGKFGSLEEGMLQNRIGTGNPEATYRNPRKEANTIFFVVDTTETQMNEDFTLTFVVE